MCSGKKVSCRNFITVEFAWINAKKKLKPNISTTGYDQLWPNFRTDTLLEIFEDAPDDNANWGEVVDTDKKFYHTSSSSAGASSSDENNSTQKGGR